MTAPRAPDPVIERLTARVERCRRGRDAARAAGQDWGALHEQLRFWETALLRYWTSGQLADDVRRELDTDRD